MESDRYTAPSSSFSSHSSWKKRTSLLHPLPSSQRDVNYFYWACRMYDRKLSNPWPVKRSSSYIINRIELLVGVTGVKMAKYRDSWKEVIFTCINVVWRPHLLGILLFEVWYIHSLSANGSCHNFNMLIVYSKNFIRLCSSGLALEST